MYDPRLDKLADVLVGYSLNVKKDDMVVIKGPALSEPLLIALSKRVLEAGGNPVVRCQVERVEELICGIGTGKQLDFLSPSDKLDLEKADCYAVIWASANTRSMTQADPRKQKARSLARKPLLDTLMRRSSLKGRNRLRWVGTQFPCHASAHDAEMSLADYADFVFGAGRLDLPDPTVHWRKVRDAQKRMCDVLNRAKEVRFVSNNGTDLTVGVAGRKWINCDGTNNFPDGEVFTGPIESATQGVVRYSFPAVAGGREVNDIVLRFKDGRVVDASASKNQDFLYQMMDQDKGGRVLGEIAIGTNYAIRNYTKNTLFDEKIGGTFHAALGAAYPETGGKNTSGLHWDMVCDLRQGGRIEVDGKVISKDGRFVNKTWPAAASRDGRRPLKNARNKGVSNR
jgi:aminopeptidase